MALDESLLTETEADTSELTLEPTVIESADGGPIATAKIDATPKPLQPLVRGGESGMTGIATVEDHAMGFATVFYVLPLIYAMQL